eukprot:CAMPEP_0179149214 /NCGR_PEP_ID=MMETSP0796-20121207/72269_1 /TAXON_ID=73915 /ORGANISM="Pyrodinium bahamense, Strain pbaha01" /LENGTH=154 /DNA_ID=CAMNT_0020850027 /DNA_START=40 /DNA_END=501 /DNA_ORIENTATION=+
MSGQMYVVKRNGQQQAVNLESITRRITQLSEGLDPKYVDPDTVARKVVEGFYNGIKTSEIDALAAETCAYMSQRHPDFSTLAARIAVSNLHKNTSDSFSETCRALHDYHDKGFKTLEKSYLLRVHGKIVERPQHVLMRVACGIHFGNVAAAIET